MINSSYIGVRPEILNLISKKPRKVLDIGCSTGDLGCLLRSRFSCYVHGVDVSAEAVAIAESRLDSVDCCGVDEYLATHENLHEYDLVVLADVLEHVTDPWCVLSQVRAKTKEGTQIIVSLPNVRHVSVLWDLVFVRQFRYRDAGILDRTHLRFFAINDMLRLFRRSGLSIVNVIRVFRVSYRHDGLFCRVSNRVNKLGLAWIPDLFVYQYVWLLA